MLNLFYAEPDPDRWLPFDRYPRRWIRRIVRGKPRPGGHMRVFLNLCAGLDRLGVPYRVNDYRHLRKSPGELACVVGKPFLLYERPWENPILYGAAVCAHPSDDPDLPSKFPIRSVLVPCEWMRSMFEPYWGSLVKSWPVGIDTDQWKPAAQSRKDIDVLFYDKVRWKHEEFEPVLIDPIVNRLRRDGRSSVTFRYGFYEEEDFLAAVARCRCMVFLCEHETQGIAYQQVLAAGVPIFAWDRGGPWQDPTYYPDKAVFGPVSTVPYWDGRCGATFPDAPKFDEGWSAFWDTVKRNEFSPRDYILENLTLERCASHYLELAREAEGAPSAWSGNDSTTP